jgi:hypothetical protein
MRQGFNFSLKFCMNWWQFYKFEDKIYSAGLTLECGLLCAINDSNFGKNNQIKTDHFGDKI